MNFKTCPTCGSTHAHDMQCAHCHDDITVNPSSFSGGDDPTIAPSGFKADDVDQWVGGNDSQTRDFGDYVLLNELARGGMGVVFKAQHKDLDRIVAIKMILSGQYSSDSDVQRFQLEAKAAAQLDHPGIVPIYEISSYQGQPYFAMKLVEGGSLAENRARFVGKARKSAELLIAVSRAVHHAHQRGILHRDIKPANILLEQNDRPLLTDLGLAKWAASDSNLTQTGAVLGTPSYMPPEQAKSSQSLTTAVDIYALGAILYELLVGKPPHRADSALETVLQVLNEPIVPIRKLNTSVDRDLELICMKCLHREPDSRYATAGELADDLERWLGGRPISVKPARLAIRVSQWVKHNQGIAYVIMLFLAGMMVAMPLIFSILGVLDDAAGIYANTEADPQPFIYSFTQIPMWVSVLCGFVAVLLWPALGMLVTLVTRPQHWWTAAGNGSCVAALTMLLMTLLMGWAVFAIASQAAANEPIRLLASNLWPADGSPNSVDVESRLVKKYPQLATMPYNQKVNFLSNRIFADGVAIGPGVALGLLVMAFFLGLPIVMGAVIAQQLLLRGQRWWLFGPRYLMAWCAAFTTTGMLAVALADGRINGTRFWEYQIWQQGLWLIGPPIVLFLLMRSWRSKSKPKS